MIYEHRSEAMLPPRMFLKRLLLHGFVAIALLGISLGVGITGYHFLGGLSWLDAILNSAMILGGMGPVDVLEGAAAKLFASFYALYSGIVFLVCAGVIVAPIFHRIAHRLQLEPEDESNSP